MTHFKELVQQRRSCRQYTNQEINAEDVTLLLRAALMSPTSKNQRAWQFIVVDNKLTLEQMSDAKEQGSHFLKNAMLAVVVLGNSTENDCWIEDGAIAAIAMQYQAEELGLGSCWIQIRGRGLTDGTTANEVIKGILNIPDEYNVLCVVAFGYKAKERKPQNEEALLWENVHIDKF